MRDDVEFREAQKGRDVQRYADYLHGQARELLTGFGQVDIMWYDFSYPRDDWGWSKGKGRDDWRSEELLAMTRELQPSVIVNDRLDLPEAGGIKTPEQYQPRGWMEVDGRRVLWEACQTFGGSWGYYRDEYTYKSVDMLVRMLVDTVSKGGNLLLNVGPNARGELDPRAVERLRGMGEWMRLHDRSIYGCTASDFTPPPDCRYTQNGDRLYLHLFAWPFRHVHLDGMAGRIEYAQLLNDGSEIKMLSLEPDPEAQTIHMGGTSGTLTLELPVRKPPVTVPVVELFLK
jgi:alpha-L-fucosidase